MATTDLHGARAALVARLGHLIEALSEPEVVELTSVPDAMARAHGMEWGTVDKIEARRWQS